MNYERRKERLPVVIPSGFFALRTPMLPMEELLRWSDGLTAANVWKNGTAPDAFENAWKQDVQRLRERLREIVSRPEVVHALYIASPSLQAGLEHWKRDPDGKKGLQAERALVRYLARMTGRSTPFGLFSAYSVGKLDCQSESTVFRLGPRSDYRLSCRLDFDYLFALTTALRQDTALETELRYYPNSSLHRVAEAWYYIESRMSDTQRTHHVVKIGNDAYIEAAIDAAQNGATISQLVKAVLNAPGDANPLEEEAQQYVIELVRNNELLVPNLSPLVTGTSPLDDIITQLEALPSGSRTAGVLRDVRTRISAIEQSGVLASPDVYKAIPSELEKLPGKFDVSRLFQVDMVKPLQQASLSGEVIKELTRGVEILCRLGNTAEPDELRTFREAFTSRYERAMVPLLDALDEESGVGFGAAVGKSDASPLLRGLRLQREGQNVAGSGRELGVHEAVLRQLADCLSSGKEEMELDLSELDDKVKPDVKLTDAFCVVGTLVAASPERLEGGDFEFYLHGSYGPSGARLLGRFCHTDPQIEACVRDHLRQEELHNPDAVYAEVVYLPEGRIGNVLCRPVLRDYEIPYLGRSGAPAERQLPVSDLMVGLEGNEIVLYSRRLQRRVIPRLTNAHGFMNPQLSPVYRFLCCLQHQHGNSVPGFSWGALNALHHLPRVRTGRLVLALARWTLTEKEVEAVGDLQGSHRFAAIQTLRHKRRLPRWVVFQEGDNHMPVDLENALSVDALVHVLKRGCQATLLEMYPAPDQMCVTGPEGTFHHELNVPFVRKVAVSKTDDCAGQVKRLPDFEAAVSREDRILPPGSEWLYVKLYGGTGALDDILTKVVYPLVLKLEQSKDISRWFFVRYADPGNHLRIRFHGLPDQLRQQALPLLYETLNPLVSSGELWKIEFATYQREIERYGGADGMIASEDLFHADSEAVLEILQELAGDEGLDIRWRAAIMGIDRLLSDFGFDDKAKQAAAHRWRKSLHAEFKVEAAGKKQLAERFRTERRKLESLFDDLRSKEPQWDFARRAFERRSARNLIPCQRLRKMSAEGMLGVKLEDIASSLVHMHINRLIRASQRAHEVVLYDFLAQLYDGRLARKARAEALSPVSS